MFATIATSQTWRKCGNGKRQQRYLITKLTSYKKQPGRKLLQKHYPLSLKSTGKKNQHCPRGNASPETIPTQIHAIRST